MAQALASTNDLESVLGLVIDALRDVLHADRASVFQYDAGAGELFATRAHGLPTDLRLPADKGIVGEAAQTKRAVNIPDAYADERFNRSVDESTGYRTRCLLTIPLLDPEGGLVGVAQVLNKSESHGGVFTPTDEGVAAHLAVQAAVAIKRAALIEAERAKRKYEADLRVARDIQRSAMPGAGDLPTIPGYDLASLFEPAEETGGDAFDVIPTPGRSEPERYTLLMADATGHGVGPALSVVQVLAMVRMACRLESRPEAVASAVNRQLCRDLPAGRFVTAFIGSLDPRTHELRYVSAGQAPIVLVPARFDAASGDADACCSNASAMPLGIDADLAPDPTPPIVFAPGDALALLSDGYYEAASPGGELFGQERVVRHIAARARDGAARALASLRSEVDAFTEGAPPEDDMTGILLVRGA